MMRSNWLRSLHEVSQIAADVEFLLIRLSEAQSSREGLGITISGLSEAKVLVRSPEGTTVVIIYTHTILIGDS